MDYVVSGFDQRRSTTRRDRNATLDNHTHTRAEQKGPFINQVNGPPVQSDMHYTDERHNLLFKRRHTHQGHFYGR